MTRAVAGRLKKFSDFVSNFVPDIVPLSSAGSNAGTVSSTWLHTAGDTVQGANRGENKFAENDCKH